MIYIILYLAAIVAANLLVAAFGPSMIIVNAAVFIGLDLTARDRLHRAWRGDWLAIKMGALVAAGSAISWALNSDAANIATASFFAFACAAMVDAVVYHRLFDAPAWVRINGSNIPAALVDSLLFPTLAFGSIMPGVVAGQFIAKVLGGAVWARVLND